MFDLLFLFTFLLPPLSCLNFIWYGFVDSLPNLLHLLTFFFLLFCSMFVLNIGFFMIFQHCILFFFYFEVLILLLFMYFLRDIFPFQLYIHDVCCEENVSRHVPLYILGFVRNVLIVYWKYSLSEKQSLDFIF